MTIEQIIDTTVLLNNKSVKAEVVREDKYGKIYCIQGEFYVKDSELENFVPTEQSLLVGKRVHALLSEGSPTMGTIVRDDVYAPHYGLIKLDDGRVVEMGECYWKPTTDVP